VCVDFLGRMGGGMPSPEDIKEKIKQMIGKNSKRR